MTRCRRRDRRSRHRLCDQRPAPHRNPGQARMENETQLLTEAKRSFSEEDYEKAFYLYEALARRGHTESQVFVGWMLFVGFGVPANAEQALQWFANAALAGSAKGMFYYGRALTASARHTEAISWYEQAEQRGYVPATYRLGIAYRKGLGVPRDKQRGLSYLHRAAEAGHVLAKREIALAYMRGERGLLMAIVGFARFCSVVIELWHVARKDRYADMLMG